MTFLNALRCISIIFFNERDQPKQSIYLQRSYPFITQYYTLYHKFSHFFFLEINLDQVHRLNLLDSHKYFILFAHLLQKVDLNVYNLNLAA